MDPYSLNNCGGVIDIVIKNQEVILSGIFTGISGLFARKAMIDAGPNSTFLHILLFNPMFWLSGIAGLAGFAYLQLSLHRHDISFVEPIVSSLAIITPVILAEIFIGEYVSLLGWIGIGIMILGVIGISGNKKEKKFLDILTGKLQ